MKLRNNIFAAAFDYLKRNTDIKTQKELARRMGVTENTITRILRDYTEVTEDIITKLQTASGCVFNLQWLRGEDSEHMLAVDVVETPKESQPVIDQSSMVNASLSAYIQLTNRLTDDLKKKEIEMQERLAEKDARIEEYKNKYGARIQILPIEYTDLYSAKIRERVKAGRSIRYMVHYKAVEYIKKHKLYISEQ